MRLLAAPAALPGGARLGALLNRFAARPEAQSAERPSLELQEAEEARARAEAGSIEKSRFLATVSHEIRTPLNGMLGMTELLRATDLDAEQRSYVEAIRASGASLAALIDEILDFSKIEAGKLELNEAPFDLTGLVEGVAELLAPRAHEKGLDIASLVCADVPPRIVGDAARLRQVLVNLVGNAVKFTERGGVGLRVTTAGTQLKFAVIDSGPGVPEQKRRAIFDEFETSASEGSGLGLAISKRLTERMGGNLQLDSSSPEGSTFVLSLPLSSEARANAPHAFRDRVLIVANSPFEAPYLAEKLGQAGTEVLRARNADEALAIFAGGRIMEALIVDCALGEDARRLGKVARAAGIRSLVLLSAQERRSFGSLREFDGWLVKPLRSASLFARLSGDALPSLSTPAAAKADLSGREILLAEDNDINALIVIRYLEKSGARVFRVSDGKAALAQAANRRFDAIILDLRMPGVDGLEVARRIRAAELASCTTPCRLIAVSADAFEAAGEAARAAGADLFLTKPVDLQRLAEALA
ncbi:MAG TPA: ATP-binding protein [Methylovirgula sp.]|nr:ATP-binding protein [Methylovirgula sp.]